MRCLFQGDRGDLLTNLQDWHNDKLSKSNFRRRVAKPQKHQQTTKKSEKKHEQTTEKQQKKHEQTTKSRPKKARAAAGYAGFGRFLFFRALPTGRLCAHPAGGAPVRRLLCEASWGPTRLLQPMAWCVCFALRLHYFALLFVVEVGGCCWLSSLDLSLLLQGPKS